MAAWYVMLKEHADANKYIVQYYNETVSGPPHDPTYCIKVKILSKDTPDVEGTGKTKKAAKYQAARALLRALVNQADESPTKSHISADDCETQRMDERGDENVIGELQVQ